MILIGLTGLKGHGKDTVAKMLVDEHSFTLLRFADPLKNMLRAFYRTLDVPGCEIEARIEGVLKQTPCPYLEYRTPRHAMQTIGTEWGRDCMDQALWVNTLQRRAQRLDRVVVPDVRFGNECDAIKHSGGIVLRVDAGGRVPADEFSNHSSEQEIKDLPVDGCVDNSGSISDLKTSVRQSLAGLFDFNQAPVKVDGGYVGTVNANDG